MWNDRGGPAMTVMAKAGSWLTWQEGMQTSQLVPRGPSSQGGCSRTLGGAFCCGGAEGRTGEGVQTSQPSRVLLPPQEASTGSLLRWSQSEITRNSTQCQLSVGLWKLHFSPKLTLSRVGQGSCLRPLHTKGKHPWNLLFTQPQIRELTPEPLFAWVEKKYTFLTWSATREKKDPLEACPFDGDVSLQWPEPPAAPYPPPAPASWENPHCTRPASPPHIQVQFIPEGNVLVHERPKRTRNPNISTHCISLKSCSPLT